MCVKQTSTFLGCLDQLTNPVIANETNNVLLSLLALFLLENIYSRSILVIEMVPSSFAAVNDSHYRIILNCSHNSINGLNH